MNNSITICLNGINHQVLCGRCNKNIDVIGVADPTDGLAGCIGCGYIDNVREIAQSVVKFAKDEAEILIDLLAKKDSLEKISKRPTHKVLRAHSYRYVIQLKV